jgi:hypothetical protein
MTIELKTGIERENRREDYITKQAGAPLDREMSIPQWEAFLDTVTDHNGELQKYLQRLWLLHDRRHDRTCPILFLRDRRQWKIRVPQHNPRRLG